MIKVIEVEKDGVVYSRCKKCSEKSEKFVSILPNPNNRGLIRHSFNGLDWAFKNGYKLKRFTIC